VDLKGIGDGAFKNARGGAPIVQTGSGSLTFQSSIRIPQGKVGEWLIVRIKANAGAGSGTGTATISSLVNRILGQIESNRFSFEGATLPAAALASQLLVTQYPGQIAPAACFTDTVIAAANTEYEGIYKIAQGIPPGILNLRLDTVALANAFTGLSLSGTPTVTVEFIVAMQDAELDTKMKEFYLVSGESATSVTAFELHDVSQVTLVHASDTMAGYSIGATDGTAKTAAELSSDEDLATARLSTGSYKLLPLVFDADPVDVKITNSSAVSFSAIVVRNAKYTVGLAKDVQRRYAPKKVRK